MDLPDIKQGTGETAVKELTGLVNEEDRMGQEMGSIRRRLSKLDQLSSTVGEYNTTLTSQEDRLKGVGWFEEKLNNTHECPMCAAVHTEGNPRLVELKTLAHELKSLSASVMVASIAPSTSWNIMRNFSRCSVVSALKKKVYGLATMC